MQKSINLGQEIKIARIKKGLKQYELAKLLQVTKVSISRWESGSRTPPADVLLKISQILDLNHLFSKDKVFPEKSDSQPERSHVDIKSNHGIEEIRTIVEQAVEEAIEKRMKTIVNLVSLLGKQNQDNEALKKADYLDLKRRVENLENQVSNR